MMLDGKEIRIAKFTSETLEPDLIVYNEEDNKIVVLNGVAAVIWNYVIDANSSGDSNIDDIVCMLMKKYNIAEERIEEIRGDVEETINHLIEASLIKLVYNG